jgi:hypothetical protein
MLSGEGFARAKTLATAAAISFSVGAKRGGGKLLVALKIYKI